VLLEGAAVELVGRVGGAGKAARVPGAAVYDVMIP